MVLTFAGKVGGRMSLSERDMGELLTLLRELSQKAETAKNAVIELRDVIALRFDTLFEAYKGFSDRMDSFDRRLRSFATYAKIATGLFAAMLATLIGILLRLLMFGQL